MAQERHIHSRFAPTLTFHWRTEQNRRITSLQLAKRGEGERGDVQNRAACPGQSYPHASLVIISLEGLVFWNGFRTKFVTLSEGPGCMFLQDINDTCLHLPYCRRLLSFSITNMPAAASLLLSWSAHSFLSHLEWISTKLSMSIEFEANWFGNKSQLCHLLCVWRWLWFSISSPVKWIQKRYLFVLLLWGSKGIVNVKCLVCVSGVYCCVEIHQVNAKAVFLKPAHAFGSFEDLIKKSDLDSVELGGHEILCVWQVPMCYWSKDHALSSKVLKDFMIRILHFQDFCGCWSYCVSTTYADSCLLCVWKPLPHPSGLYFAYPCCWPFCHLGLLFSLASDPALLSVCLCPLD